MTPKPDKNNRKMKTAGKETAKLSNQPNKNLPSPAKDLLDILDNFFSGKSKLFYFIALGLTILLACLLFDVKVGPGGDDSAYILRAYDFVHGFSYPGYQGPMYPFLLSPFILLFGIKLPLLKFLSLISLVISIVFLYKAFNKRIPGFILSGTLLLISINYFVLYFGSQTYSEAFFMMVQSIFFWYFASRILDRNPEQWILPQYIMMGFLMFLMTLTKSIAFAAVIAIAAFYIVNRRWKDLLYTTGSFISFYSVFELLKRMLWGNTNLQFASQGSGLMYKDFYNPSMGKEDFSGFIQRFFDNSNLYFSKHLYKFLGFRDEYATDINPFLTILTYAILIAALVYCLRKNKLLFFIGIYVLSMCSVEFLVLQKHWDQWRLIIIFYPLILMLVFSALYFLFKQPKLKSFQFLVPIIAVIIFFSSFSVTNDHIKLQRPILERNLKGDLLYGLTPDWVNYIQMSKWAAKNIPQDQKIASRKPEISFVYSGRRFTGISKVPVVLLDTFLQRIKPDTSVFMAVRLKKLNESKQMLSGVLSNKIYAVVSGEFSFGDNETDNSNVICIYRLTKPEFEIWSKKIREENIYLETNIEAWLTDMHGKKTDFVISSPDELLQNLRNNQIRYILLGSLRLNPYENTGNIINTIHRYLYFIQLKYPTAFKEINKFGTDEVASLVEVNLN
jgi:hypothetical protein